MRAQPFDLVSTLTFPLPATIVFSFMGVPEPDWPQLKEWCGSRASLGWGRPAPSEQVDHATNMAAYRGYLRQLVAAKADDRADDFASALLEIHDEDPDALTHEEIASILFSLSFAGHETTNYLIGNLVRRMLEDRSRWEAVERGPGADRRRRRRDAALRHVGPGVAADDQARRDDRRRRDPGGLEAVPVAVRVRPRRERVPESPRRFDLTRENAHRCLAFGKGIHYCVGASLGKLEARLALEGLVTRWPELRLEPQEIPFHPNISFRGPLRAVGQRPSVRVNSRALARTLATSSRTPARPARSSGSPYSTGLPESCSSTRISSLSSTASTARSRKRRTSREPRRGAGLLERARGEPRGAPRSRAYVRFARPYAFWTGPNSSSSSRSALRSSSSS